MKVVERIEKDYVFTQEEYDKLCKIKDGCSSCVNSLFYTPSERFLYLQNVLRVLKEVLKIEE